MRDEFRKIEASELTVLPPGAIVDPESGSEQLVRALDEYVDTLNQLDTNLSAVRVELGQAQAGLNTAQSELQYTKAEMEYTKAEISEAQSNLSKIKKQLETVSSEKQKLKAQLDTIWLERERFRLQVEQIYASHSYRVTAPLRRATDAVRALRASLRNMRAKVSPLITKIKFQIRRFSNWLKTTTFGKLLLDNLRKHFPGLWKKIAKRLETDIRPDYSHVLTGFEAANPADSEYFAALFDKENKLKP